MLNRSSSHPPTTDPLSVADASLPNLSFPSSFNFSNRSDSSQAPIDYNDSRSEDTEIKLTCLLARVNAITHKFNLNDLETKTEDEILTVPPIQSKKNKGPSDYPRLSTINPYLEDLRSLGKEVIPHKTQIELFRKYNYLKYQIVQLRENLNPAALDSQKISFIENLLTSTDQIRNQLFESNLRLVVSIVKKYAHPSTNKFQELVSDGNMDLLNAIEGFDYSLGYRFSTYASWVIIRNARTTYAKGIKHSLASLEAQPEEFLPSISVQFSDNLSRERHYDNLKGQINKILGAVQPFQRDIIIRRFGLEEFPAETLEAVGKSFSLTKERVRQIESAAILLLAAEATRCDIETLSMFAPETSFSSIRDSILIGHSAFRTLREFAIDLDCKPALCVIIRSLWFNPIKGISKVEDEFINCGGAPDDFESAFKELQERKLVRRFKGEVPLFKLLPDTYWMVHDLIGLDFYRQGGSIDQYLKELTIPSDFKRRVS